jgi:hypothetical protein
VSVASYFAAKRRCEAMQAFEAEVIKAIERVGQGNRIRVTAKIAKAALLKGPLTYDGRNIEITVKSIGCGVYEMWDQEVKP